MQNYTCGEGGALVLNDNGLIERAEIMREKGTNRSKFIRGEINKYSWVDMGSSYLPSDILAAYLLCQLENMDEIRSERKRIYEHYLEHLGELADEDIAKLPEIPEGCETNYHMFYLVLDSKEHRNRLLEGLKSAGIAAVFHYIPLHTSDFGRKFGYKESDLPLTESISTRVIRLPFFYGLTETEQDHVIEKVLKIAKKHEN
jgi:dTDP-4-amino-4,6-dideoxygalactose transaminase